MHKLILLALLVAAVVAQDPAAQKAHILCVIDTQLSSDGCKRTARVQVEAESGSDPASGCAKLETFKPLLGIIGCTTADYDALHKVICENDQTPCTHAA